MDRSHTLKASSKYYQAGADMEPTRKKKRGHPKNTWRRDLQMDIKNTGYTWRQLENRAQDRHLWKTVVNGLCHRRDEGHN